MRFALNFWRMEAVRLFYSQYLGKPGQDRFLSS